MVLIRNSASMRGMDENNNNDNNNNEDNNNNKDNNQKQPPTFRTKCGTAKQTSGARVINEAKRRPRLVGIDVQGGKSGTSADVPRFGLRLHSVSSAIGSQQKFGAKFEEIGDFWQIYN